LQEQKEYFKELMPFLRNLDEEEQRILLHKIRNQNRNSEDSTECGILNELSLQTVEKKLSLLSEEENFNEKNRYRLQR
jgi:hypothetical protein